MAAVHNGRAAKEAAGGPSTKWLHVTPDMAVKLLEANTHNRPLKQHDIDCMARDMKGGRFNSRNGETLKFTKSGILADGQNRLWAVVESKTAIDFLIVYDVDEDAIETVDIGSPRKLGDIMALSGMSHGTVRGSAAKMIMWYEGYRPKKLAYETCRPSKSEMMTFVRKLAVLDQAVSLAMSHRRFGTLATPSISVFVTYYGIKYDLKTTEEFLYGMQTGTDLTQTSAVHVLREKLIAYKNSGRYSRAVDFLELTAWCVKGFNAFANNRSLRSIRWQTSEDFPTFVK